VSEIDLADLAFLNLIDLLLLVIILFGVITGLGRGFLLATLQLLTLAASLLIAFAGYHYPEAWLQAYSPGLGLWIPPLSFLSTYVLAHLVIGAGASGLSSSVPAWVHTHFMNRGLGLLPGFVNGLINAAIAALLLVTLPLTGEINNRVRESEIVNRLSAPAEWLEAQLAPIFHPAISRTLQALTVPAESTSTVKLPYKADNPEIRPDLEARMLEMINAERAAQGLKALQPDPEMAEVARAHSRDMFQRSYFSHVNPEGQEPFDRMRKARIRYLVAGENLALAQTLPAAHQGLMNSPGHRANILRPQYGRAGIGVLDGGRYGLMVTQNFRN
jgi:uncharacterized protein YkwD